MIFEDHKKIQMKLRDSLIGFDIKCSLPGTATSGFRFSLNENKRLKPDYLFTTDF